MKNRDSKLRFSIRKLTIGAVSVMFGAIIFGVSSNQVHADVKDSNDSQVKPEVKSKITTDSKTPDKVVVTVNKTDSSQSAATRSELADSKVEKQSTPQDTTDKASVNDASTNSPKENEDSHVADANKKADSSQFAADSQVKISTDDPNKPLPKGQGRLVVNYAYNDPDQGLKFVIKKSDQYVGPIGSVVTAKQILSRIPAGFYALQEIHPDNNPKYTDIEDQTIKTDIDILQKNPDGSGIKAVPSYYVNLWPLENGTKEYKRTIHFMLEDGGQSNGAKTPADIVQDVVIHTHERLDEDGNLVVDKDGDIIPRVNLPEVPGYVPEKNFVMPEVIPTITGQKITPSEFQTKESTQADTVYVKYYVANRERRVIYHDEENNQNIKSDLLHGRVGNAISYRLNLPDDYALAPDQGVPSNLIPINIQNPDIVINVVPLKSEHDTHRRVIHYWIDKVGGKQAFPDVTQNIAFDRNQILDDTYHAVWTPWNQTSYTFDEIKSPEMKGYTADRLSLPAKTIYAQSPEGGLHTDDIEDIVYNPNTESVRVVYRDSDTKKFIKIDSLNGKYDHTISYNAKLPAGYAFSRDQILPTSIKFGEQNPDLTIWLDPLKTETDHYVRTVHYVYADGTKAAEDYTFTFDFTRSQHVDQNGYAEWGAWNKDHIDVPATISPKITGYTPSNSKILERVVIPGIGFDEAAGPSSVPTLEEKYTITYTPNPESIRVVYRDSVTKKFIKIDSLNGNYNQTIDYKTTLPNGYAFNHDQILPTSIKFGEQNPDLTIWLDPLKTETDHYVRTVHYVYADGTKAAEDYTFTFDFTRSQHVDQNGYAEWGAWNKDHIDVPDVESKNIPGYTPTYAKIAGRSVTAGVGFDEATGPSSVPTLSEEFTVIYNKNAQPTKPVQPTKPEQPTKPTQATNASQPTNAPVLPENQPTNAQPTNAPVLPQDQPTAPANPGEESTVRPHASDVPAANKEKHGKTETVRPHATHVEGQATVKPLATRVHQNASANKEELPQTGDKENEAGLLGLAVASLGLFGLITDRKRKN